VTIFQNRHLGLNKEDISSMLETLGDYNIETLMDKVFPDSIRWSQSLKDPKVLTETEALKTLAKIADKNSPGRCFIGQGFYDTVTPSVIQRNVMENPAWYTAYTPYQSEISQGRLEALLNYQTCVSDLTALPVANASLLDEATAAAEAMTMFKRANRNGSVFLVSEDCHPQTIAVILGRADPLGIQVKVESHNHFIFDESVFGALIQYPNTIGAIHDYAQLCKLAHDSGVFICVATDLMALTLLKPPGEFGADVAIGNSQRFGVPLGYGGPHAAFFATTDQFKRLIPGRIIGVTMDAEGNHGLRMALQTREQHIRRDKATSNICTAQVLLAIMSGMYAVYHGSKGLKKIAERIHNLTHSVYLSLKNIGAEILEEPLFDTVHFKPLQGWQEKAERHNISVRQFKNGMVGISIDETTTHEDLVVLLDCFGAKLQTISQHSLGKFLRESPFMEHSVFESYQTETELLRYIKHLEKKDFSLADGMIPLGSCTMKLNATTQMKSLSLPGFAKLHPFIHKSKAMGYISLMDDLKSWLCSITGFHDISFQPNSGAQGEYAGLMVIRAHHHAQGQFQRKICLIPSSAHGTNPASAIMAGMEVVVVDCDDKGNVNLSDLISKAKEAKNQLAACMITYPSTHGVFEKDIREICDTIHSHGGLVYLDGANMNAMVGLSRPADFGADVCHLNLHKTFAIPHGGGGPGMGPIGVAKELAKYLPGHPEENSGSVESIHAISAAPYGSASILTISWAYMALLGAKGLTDATKIAILNANYLAKKLEDHYSILFRGNAGLVAHEFILDLREFRKNAGITEEDLAKRLIDFGFHAPTMSWPVPGTMMVEPTESESKKELDRFVEAMIAIRREIDAIIAEKIDKKNNPLKNAPHTITMVTDDQWKHSYTREQAVFPVPSLKEKKFWPTVARIDNAFGDRNLVCTCPPLAIYKENSD
tara:strand:- start:20768 stop:23581 length:2814 start_codon:yes stop_codon:yes gene_type:complete